jgi:transmembrane sensor
MRVQNERLRELVAEEAATWFVENREGTLTAQQEEEFMQWLQTSPVHVAEYLAISGVGRDIGGVAKSVDTPLADLVHRVAAESNISPLRSANEARVRKMAMKPQRRPLLLGSPIVRFSAIAAALVILIGSWSWLTYREKEQRFATRHGEERTLVLADNTVVHLNSDSAISVRFDQHRRRVAVESGQALFEVAKDAARPFQVRAGNSVIEDIGTVFDVFRQSAQTVVTVVEGQVAVWDSSHQASPTPTSSSAEQGTAFRSKPLASLQAGDQVEIAPSGQVETQRTANVQKATAWVRHEIVFDRDSIASVAAEFNRYNTVQIEVNDPRISDMPISGVFHTYDVQSFTDFLNGLHGVHTSLVGRQLIVSSGSAPSVN